ncbi:MAG: hypothetical protein QOJ13_16 [Gaiellales bacterium]|nr:hypothetical protein [Gaiellales bacterium]
MALQGDGVMPTLGTAPTPGDGAPSDEPSGLTLEDLLAEQPFRLQLVTGGDEQLRRPVRGAHSVEGDVAAAALDPDWIVLTTGTNLVEDPDAQRRLIAVLDDAGAAGLGVCLGKVHRAVPAGLAEEAGRRGLPVFTVPKTTPVREVIAFVHRSLVSEEVLAFSRMTALERFLLDALSHEDPTRVLIERLAEFIGAKVGLLSPNGQFAVATAADLPGGEIVESLAGRKLLTVPFAAGGVHGHAFAVGDPDRSDACWLVIAVPERRRVHPLTKAAGSTTVTLLAAIERLDQGQRRRDDAARRAALEALLDAETPQAASVAAAQISTWGMDIGAGVVVVVIDDPVGSIPVDALLEHILAAADLLDGALLATVYENRVVVLLPAPVTDDTLAGLTAAAPGVRVGIGRAVVEPPLVRRSLAEAVLAAGATAQEHVVGRYDDLDLSTLVLQELHLERLAPKIEEWLGPLRGTPRVFETLIAYFEHNLDIGKTAHALHLHPNSVRYRLSRAEDLIGAPVRSPSTLIALHVALAAASRTGQPLA